MSDSIYMCAIWNEETGYYEHYSRIVERYIEQVAFISFDDALEHFLFSFFFVLQTFEWILATDKYK